MALREAGWPACSSDCCRVVYDDEIGRGPVRDNVTVRPMFQVIDQAVGSDTVCMEYGERVEDWDFERETPAGFNPDFAPYETLRALLGAS